MLFMGAPAKALARSPVQQGVRARPGRRGHAA